MTHRLTAPPPVQSRGVHESGCHRPRRSWQEHRRRKAAGRYRLLARGQARGDPRPLRAQLEAVRVCVPAGRASRRARARHYHRCRPRLLQEQPARLPPARCPRPLRVPAQHDHRRRARRSGAARHRRARRRARQLAPPRLSAVAARHPPARRDRQQDGPGGSVARRVRSRGRRVSGLPVESPGDAVLVHPGQRHDRREHRRSRPAAPLVQRADRARSARRVHAGTGAGRCAVPHAGAGRLQVHRQQRRSPHCRRQRRDRPRPRRRRADLPAVRQTEPREDDRSVRAGGTDGSLGGRSGGPDAHRSHLRRPRRDRGESRREAAGRHDQAARERVLAGTRFAGEGQGVSPQAGIGARAGASSTRCTACSTCRAWRPRTIA